jgi:hypothetical protein
MSDPAFALQQAIAAVLKANAEVAELIGPRVYDRVPPKPQYPYGTIGDDRTVPDRADAYDGSEVAITLHAWSQAPGSQEARRIRDAMREALHLAELDVAGFHLVDLAVVESLAFRDPDGLTTHAVLRLRAQLEPAD